MRHCTFDAIGTRWNIEISEPVSNFTYGKLLGDIKKRIEEFDKNYSRFRDDSLVTIMSKSPGIYELPADAKLLLDLYEQLYLLTHGAVTPLIGQALVNAGYDTLYSLQPKEMQATPSWEEVVDYAFPTLALKQPALLDFGAAGKGYLVDIIAEIIERRGIRSYGIDAGGDILYRNAKDEAVEVGLEHPKDPSLAVGIAKIRNQSLCGSSIYKRAWGSYHHIIDPANGKSPKEIAAVWVVADSTLLADGLTTALFFIPASTLQQQYNFDYAIVRADLSLETSANFPAHFFNQQEVVYA